jgi:hypothetical protein
LNVLFRENFFVRYGVQASCQGIGFSHAAKHKQWQGRPWGATASAHDASTIAPYRRQLNLLD